MGLEPRAVLSERLRAGRADGTALVSLSPYQNGKVSPCLGAGEFTYVRMMYIRLVREAIKAKARPKVLS